MLYRLHGTALAAQHGTGLDWPRLTWTALHCTALCCLVVSCVLCCVVCMLYVVRCELWVMCRVLRVSCVVSCVWCFVCAAFVSCGLRCVVLCVRYRVVPCGPLQYTTVVHGTAQWTTVLGCTGLHCALHSHASQRKFPEQKRQLTEARDCVVNIPEAAHNTKNVATKSACSLFQPLRLLLSSCKM